MTNIQSQLQNRTAIKYNYIQIPENGKSWISRNMDQGLPFSLAEIKIQLLNGEFENFITVSLGDSFGPDVKPSRKTINRLMKIIVGTEYKIVQQNGQTFTLEGVN